MAASTGFPIFEDGDVQVVVSTSKIYRLHSHVLRRSSAMFADLLDRTPPTKLTAAARRDGATPWRIQLHRQNSEHEDDDCEIMRFIPILLTESGKVVFQPYPVPVSSFSASNIDLDACWDWLLGCFYSIPPNFNDADFSATVADCYKLVDIAESISAIPAVQEAVDLALMRQDKTLWVAIAHAPTQWAELGCSVESPTIFSESIIHAVGKWDMLSEEEKSGMRGEVRELCERKWEELELAKRAIDIRVAGHYPGFLCRSETDKPHRTTYAADIYMWMSLAFFRQYLSQAGNDRKNRLAKDGGYAFYKALGEGGSTYLNREDMKVFHQYFPMSSKACSVLEAHMNVLKEDVRIFARDLVRVKTHIDPVDIVGANGMPWLTCTEVGKEDLPWIKRRMGLEGTARDAWLEDDEMSGGSSLTNLQDESDLVPDWENSDGVTM